MAEVLRSRLPDRWRVWWSRSAWICLDCDISWTVGLHINISKLDKFHSQKHYSCLKVHVLHITHKVYITSLNHNILVQQTSWYKKIFVVGIEKHIPCKDMNFFAIGTCTFPPNMLTSDFRKLTFSYSKEAHLGNQWEPVLCWAI